MLGISSPISFDRPEWLWLLLLIPVLAVISRRSLAGLERPRRILAVILRSLVIAALAVALARVEIVRRNDRVAVLFVLDRSRSIPDDLREASQQYIRQVAASAERDDRVGVISADGQADVDMIPSRGGVEVFGFSMAQEPDRTNLAAGLRMAIASFPEGFARRVVLLSDGNENAGNLAEEIEIAAANRIAVDVVPLQYRRDAEILFDRLVVPSQAGRDTTIPVRMILKSRRPTRAKLTLYHNDVEVPLSDPIIELAGGMQPNRFDIPIELPSGGVHRFDARVAPLVPTDDAIAENNRATAFTFVDDQGRVLIVTRPNASDDQPLYEALRREKIDAEIRGVDEVHLDLLKLQEYGVTVLANISADTFTREQHEALASYVRDFGGGLIMTGGDESFGAGGWIGSPVEEVSPVSFEVKHKKIMPRGALVIIMHSCEIPRGNYWGEQVALASVDTISSLDYLGVLCYSFGVGGPNWDVPLAPATDKASIKRKMRQMQIGDMPDFDSTMRIAVDGLMGLPDVSQRHMVIISDGDPSPPSSTVIQRMVDNQITCSTVGIGYGSHVLEQPLRDIARQTNGRFYAVKNPKQLPQIFVKEAKVVRRPLIDDQPFSPQLLPGFSQATQGIAPQEMPQLGGLVMTQAKPDCIMPVFRRGSDGDDPVLAHWHYEMGRMAVFTSGWWPKWGGNWVGWEKFGRFWAQLVRLVARQEASADFDVLTRLEGNRGYVVVEALNRDASFLNFLSIGGRLLTPGMEQKPLYLSQTGPGRYEASFDVNEHGNYLVNLQYNTPDRERGMIRTGLSLPYSPEFRELGTNLSLLYKAAERTGGRVFADLEPRTEELFSRNLPPVVSRQPVWRWVVQWILLPLFLLDVAGRRLASSLAMSVYVEVAVLVVVLASLWAARGPFDLATWPGFIAATLYAGLAFLVAESVGWAIRYQYIVPAVRFFTASVASLGRVGQRSAESITQLKGVRDKVREDMEAPAKRPATKPTTIALEPVADRKARFDVGDAQAGKPAEDLTRSLGTAAANAQDPAAQPAKGRKPGQADDVTSRLLKAKRRAREELNDRGRDEEE